MSHYHGSLILRLLLDIAMSPVFPSPPQKKTLKKPCYILPNQKKNMTRHIDVVHNKAHIHTTLHSHTSNTWPNKKTSCWRNIIRNAHLAETRQILDTKKKWLGECHKIQSISHTIHVWNHFNHKSKPNVGKYCIHGAFFFVFFQKQMGL